MRFIYWPVFGVACALLVGCDEEKNAYREPPTMVAQSNLDGTWEILSVHRDGEADPVQVGALLTFANGEVRFQPKIRQVNANAFS